MGRGYAAFGGLRWLKNPAAAGIVLIVAATSADLERLYRERYGVFLDGMTRLLNDREEAHDVVQEAFARALRERRRFRGEGNLEAWVWRVAVNHALKTRRRLRESWSDEVIDPGPAAAAGDDDVREAVRALPPRRRLVVFLRYFADLSYDEIARVCGVSTGTVAATLAQSRAELAHHLNTEGAEQ